MHGEYLYPRFMGLSTSLVLAFNMIALAPNLEMLLPAWSLFGFSSAFLIGLYNDRPTVRANATYSFAAYTLSDLSLLYAATFAGPEPHAGAAAALLIAALFKSSQLPVTALFARSMEGPVPSSALGYAGLSAHVGLVLLAGTTSTWMAFDWACYALGGVGLTTAIVCSAIAKVRSDRKGSLAYAAAGTVGLALTTLAAGYPTAALLISLGHSAFRVVQILESPSTMNDTRSLSRGLPPSAYKSVWLLRHTDFEANLFYLLKRLSPPQLNYNLSKNQRWGLNTVALTLAGFPYTPLAMGSEHALMEMLITRPAVASILMGVHFLSSVAIFRFLLYNTIYPFRKEDR